MFVPCVCVVSTGCHNRRLSLCNGIVDPVSRCDRSVARSPPDTAAPPGFTRIGREQRPRPRRWLPAARNPYKRINLKTRSSKPPRKGTRGPPDSHPSSAGRKAVKTNNFFMIAADNGWIRPEDPIPTTQPEATLHILMFTHRSPALNNTCLPEKTDAALGEPVVHGLVSYLRTSRNVPYSDIPATCFREPHVAYLGQRIPQPRRNGVITPPDLSSNAAEHDDRAANIARV
ncbi:hypothetical protein Bbelb_183260 [Branchiostoma belcheri]|nr:hypothetical protein Bbelb_183260 [Branchiostoma belcheri]